jgi:hypothetical protein
MSHVKVKQTMSKVQQNVISEAVMLIETTAMADHAAAW